MIELSQWCEIEDELAGMFPFVKMRYQDREIAICRVRTSESRLSLTVYVDKEIRGTWILPSHDDFDPIAKKLWRTFTKEVYGPTKRKKLIKSFGKRRALEYAPRLYEKITYYSPEFNSAKSLVRQYKKLDGLELISVGYSEGVSNG